MRLVAFTLIAPAAVALLLAVCPASADETLTFDGTVTEGGLDHERIDFAVPPGIREIQIDHDDLSDDDILDWGLDDPGGFRGWGGGNTEPAVVGELAASRSYLPGAIAAGKWHVVVGKAKLVSGSASYHVVVTLRDAPTLPPQTEREPYAPAPALAAEARWYAGDLHVHSLESGDARPSLQEIASYARSRGLDFVELSDHNTVSQLDFIDAVQAAHGDLLLVPGVEYTTYAGHANGIGATAWVDHKIGQPGVDIAGAAAAFREQGALFSINHPLLDLGDACIGCAWQHELPADAIDAVEIATSGASALFLDSTLAYWDALCDTGRHIAAVGGSDDHGAGEGLGAFGTPIGTPATYVFADGLSVSALLDGIRSGRTVVKIAGATGPMVELSSEIPAEGDTVHAESTTLRAKVTGAEGLSARWVKNGVRGDEITIAGDPSTLELALASPSSGQDRYRVEVLRDGRATTITSHVWVEYLAGVGLPPAAGAAEDAGGCGCSLVGSAPASPGSLALLGAAMAALLALQKRSQSKRGGSPVLVGCDRRLPGRSEAGGLGRNS